MKFLFRMGLVAAAFILIYGITASHLKATSRHKQEAEVHFSEQVMLRDVALKGDYLFVHDDDKMAKGEPCMNVYQVNANRTSKLVVSFRCQPIEREKTERTLITVSPGSDGRSRVAEIQFAATSEGHRIP